MIVVIKSHIMNSSCTCKNEDKTEIFIVYSLMKILMVLRSKL